LTEGNEGGRNRSKPVFVCFVTKLVCDAALPRDVSPCHQSLYVQLALDAGFFDAFAQGRARDAEQIRGGTWLLPVSLSARMISSRSMAGLTRKGN